MLFFGLAQLGVSLRNTILTLLEMLIIESLRSEAFQQN